MFRRRFLLTLLAFATAFVAPAAAAAKTPTPPSNDAIAAGATLLYREISAFKSSPNSGGKQSPIISDDGQHIAYAMSPGTADPATPNIIFVAAADGSAQKEVDSYTSLCFCGSEFDVSADGSSVVSTDALQLRIANSGGGGRELISLASNEINGIRISGDGGKIFFRVYRDTTERTSGAAIERGVWVIDADGSGLRQIVNPRQMEALGLPPTDFFGSNAWTLEASADGSHLIFGGFNDPKSGGEGQGLFGVNLDGSGLRDYLGRVSLLNSATISADGATGAYAIADFTTGIQTAGVVPFEGGTPRTLFDSKTPRAVLNSGFPTIGDRITLSDDGSQLLLGSSGVLVDTATGELRALGVAVPGLADGTARLVGDGLAQATMDGTAARVIYLSGDAKGVLQLARLDISPAEPDAALTISGAEIEPTTIPPQGGPAVTAYASVDTTGVLAGVGAAVLLSGTTDPNIGAVGLIDDGTRGDATAGDGLFSNNEVRANCCTVGGDRVVRFQAEAVDADGRRVAVAVDVAGVSVVAAPVTATPGT